MPRIKLEDPLDIRRNGFYFIFIFKNPLLVCIPNGGIWRATSGRGGFI